MARGGEGGASSPDKAKLAPSWWLRCARAALNQLQAVAKKRAPNLEDDGQNCGAGGGVGDEEALDHPMKPYALQQKEDAATRKIMEDMEQGGQADAGEKVRQSLLLMQVLEEGERGVMSDRKMGKQGQRRQHYKNIEKSGESEHDGISERVHEAIKALARYHHRLQGTEPGSEGGGNGPTIVEALLELASSDRTGAAAHMLESMAVSVRALHQMQVVEPENVALPEAGDQTKPSKE